VRPARCGESRRGPERVCDTFHVAKVAASLPGFASVARASEVLHLAPRSVRGLIYAGRLPSVRLGRLHYIRAADLELERRRRLGLAAPQARPRQRHTPASTTIANTAQPRQRHAPASPRPHATADPELRRQRAEERAELVKVWAQRHAGFAPQVPAGVHEVVVGVDAPITCAACNRQVRRGRYVELSPEPGQPAASLCTACARRALLEWADRRRQEATAARRLSQSLGQPASTPVIQPRLLVA